MGTLSLLPIHEPNNGRGLTPLAGTPAAWAAPPFAVMAEEMGYFPVQNKEGQVIYVPRRVQRQSSDQAIELAKRLKQAGAVMYGACKFD